ncbi:uncharacterized protein JN550_002371 [Neoarthrinium moseri]|uniref:uncharacterized protein n=1 Tax=Neoarthrinium moseri TaxID=1658444 RepID=UPI001FDB9285|nr:uncharacterized protein JN550_002371 [Neoarthrinium moseri]KAI1874942.1 hypothetical protein JN550_002371 [Neoarthrinium moseri]
MEASSTIKYRANSDDSALDDCYFPCNAAYLKAQVSRDWEDYCAAGNAFETYWNNCLCCVQAKLDNGYKAEDYLAKDFAGQLAICESNAAAKPAKLWEPAPCTIPSSAPATPIVTPFPTQTVWGIGAPQDSLGVGVSTTYALSQLRPNHNQRPEITIPTISATPTGARTTLTTVTSSRTFTDKSGHSTVLLATETLLTIIGMESTATSTPQSEAEGVTGGYAWIAGPVVGGCVLALLLVLLGWLIRKRRASRVDARVGRQDHSEDDGDAFHTHELPSKSIPTPEIDGKVAVFELDTSEVKSTQ